MLCRRRRRHQQRRRPLTFRLHPALPRRLPGCPRSRPGRARRGCRAAAPGHRHWRLDTAAQCRLGAGVAARVCARDGRDVAHRTTTPIALPVCASRGATRQAHAPRLRAGRPAGTRGRERAECALFPPRTLARRAARRSFGRWHQGAQRPARPGHPGGLRQCLPKQVWPADRDRWLHHCAHAHRAAPAAGSRRRGRPRRQWCRHGRSRKCGARVDGGRQPQECDFPCHRRCSVARWRRERSRPCAQAAPGAARVGASCVRARLGCLAGGKLRRRRRPGYQ
mmetsp:Transcript_26417/g.85341  ORF Transcript_26417/g.85341 Transcript_26417/m.85341 type:complete len:280 (+) Transcript_26417:1629-2468(+)